MRSLLRPSPLPGNRGFIGFVPLCFQPFLLSKQIGHPRYFRSSCHRLGNDPPVCHVSLPLSLGYLPHLIPLPSGNMARLQQKFFIPSYRVSLLFFIVHFLQAKHLFRHLKLTQKSEHFGSSYRKNKLSIFPFELCFRSVQRFAAEQQGQAVHVELPGLVSSNIH